MADGDMSSATKSSSAQVEQGQGGTVNVPTPYSLFASDNPGALITSVMFTGDNYNEWSTELVNALRAKRKLGFIDGTISKPAIDDPKFELWSFVNSLIVGGIRSSIEARVRSTVTFIFDSHKLWENLKKRFSVGNKVRIHHLKEQLASCKQDGQSVMDYFGRLAKMWEELDAYKPLPPCTCSAAAVYEKEREEEKVHQFLMGLDESRFGVVCQGIIATDSSIDLGDVYSRVVLEEQRLVSSKEREVQQSAVGFVAKKEASDTQNSGQTRRLVGFPDWWEETPPTRGNNRGGRGGRGRGGYSSDRNKTNGKKVHNAHATSSNSSSFPVFTDEQLKALTQMINEKNRSTERLTGKLYGDLILDTGASHHMTGELSFLENITSIPSCPVGFADGYKTYATHTGVFRLSNSITLHNDRFTRMMIGAGEERDGVYYFKDVMAARVEVSDKSTRSVDQFLVDDFSRAVWTYLLFEKSEVQTVLKNFCKMTEKQFSKEVKVVRSDNGTDYSSTEWTSRKKASPHSEYARALLFQSNLPIKFWGEAILTAAYLINRTPSAVLGHRSPYELLYNEKPSYSQLRVFGSLCFVHHRSRDKDKFGKRSRRCVFVGYPYAQKGWKVYDLDKHEFFISRDVVFQESEFPYSAPTLVSINKEPVVPNTEPDGDWENTNLPVLEDRGSSSGSATPPVATVVEQTTPSSSPTTDVGTVDIDQSPLNVVAPASPAANTPVVQPVEEVFGRGQRPRVPSVKLKD
ncbi:uncharacterized protein LOC125610287 [Brassica napus]|uniref:uncharacterized protein LOC125610287 n=1 Tax=Brassica napus TaxID=3708 RepID=UPI002078916C|nr:uncharacterized protein LOC125610287 [Brassica napus]